MMVAEYRGIRAVAYAPTYGFRQGRLIATTPDDGRALEKLLARRTGVRALRDGRELRIVESSWLAVLNVADAFWGVK